MTEKTKYQPHWLNSKNMAKSLNVSPSTFSEYDIAPVSKMNGQKFYTTRQAVDFFLERQQQKFLSDRDSGDLLEQQTRLTSARATMQEMKNDIASREVASVDLMTRSIAKVSASAVAILGSLKLSIRRKLPHLKNTELDIIEKEVARARNAVADMPLVFDED